MTMVSFSQGSPVCLFRIPPHRTTTFSPRLKPQQAPPTRGAEQVLSEGLAHSFEAWLTLPSIVKRRAPLYGQ
jgi:hypothetical protein